ncbi:MAG: hypothetical protein K6U04_09350 [Armatimonadetes bacterium]|nr:hypothetical protein [Armatimonadota bacterium]
MEEEVRPVAEVRYFGPPGADYYYLVAGASGCPSADFRYPGYSGGKSALVVLQVRGNSAGPALPAPVPSLVPEVPVMPEVLE